MPSWFRRSDSEKRSVSQRRTNILSEQFRPDLADEPLPPLLRQPPSELPAFAAVHAQFSAAVVAKQGATVATQTSPTALSPAASKRSPASKRRSPSVDNARMYELLARRSFTSPVDPGLPESLVVEVKMPTRRSFTSEEAIPCFLAEDPGLPQPEVIEVKMPTRRSFVSEAAFDPGLPQPEVPEVKMHTRRSFVSEVERVDPGLPQPEVKMPTQRRRSSVEEVPCSFTEDPGLLPESSEVVEGVKMPTQRRRSSVVEAPCFLTSAERRATMSGLEDLIDARRDSTVYLEKRVTTDSQLSPEEEVNRRPTMSGLEMIMVPVMTPLVERQHSNRAMTTLLERQHSSRVLTGRRRPSTEEEIPCFLVTPTPPEPPDITKRTSTIVRPVSPPEPPDIKSLLPKRRPVSPPKLYSRLFLRASPRTVSPPPPSNDSSHAASSPSPPPPNDSSHAASPSVTPPPPTSRYDEGQTAALKKSNDPSPHAASPSVTPPPPTSKVYLTSPAAPKTSNSSPASSPYFAPSRAAIRQSQSIVAGRVSAMVQRYERAPVKALIPAPKRHSLDELQRPDAAIILGVDPLTKEDWLAEEDFVTHFKMPREAWGALPRWRQQVAKRKLGLL